MAPREIVDEESPQHELRARLDTYLRLSGLDARTRAAWIRAALRNGDSATAFVRVRQWLAKREARLPRTAGMQPKPPEFIWSQPHKGPTPALSRWHAPLFWPALLGTLALWFAISR